MPGPAAHTPGLMELRCPHCGRPVASAGSARPQTFPFCSKRCRLLDLGAWIDGRHAIPGRPADGFDDPR